MADLIQIRRDTLEVWDRVNPVLSLGEIGFVLKQKTPSYEMTDPVQYKVGDGVRSWQALPLQQGLSTSTKISSLVNDLNFLPAEDIESMITAETGYRESADNILDARVTLLEGALDRGLSGVVKTYANLLAHSTTELDYGDIFKVLEDETKDNSSTYYDWIVTGWKYIGKEQTYYKKPTGGIPFSDLSLAVSSSIENKQEKLVDGVTIKTINGESLLSSGNIQTDIYDNLQGLPSIEDVTLQGNLLMTDIVPDFDEIREGAQSGSSALEGLHGHEVYKTVPSDAKFTDTVYNDTELRTLVGNKQDTISDLNSIRLGALSGSTAVQEAPRDGKIYSRRNGTWVSSSSTEGAVSYLLSQSLTEPQKRTARRNQGLYYEEEQEIVAYNKVEWDGIIGSREFTDDPSYSIEFVKISNTIPAFDQLLEGSVEFRESFLNNIIQIQLSEDNLFDEDESIQCWDERYGPLFLVIKQDDIDIEVDIDCVLHFPSTGIWVVNYYLESYTKSLTVRDSIFEKIVDNIHPVEGRYFPSSEPEMMQARKNLGLSYRETRPTNRLFMSSSEFDYSAVVPVFPPPGESSAVEMVSLFRIGDLPYEDVLSNLAAFDSLLQHAESGEYCKIKWFLEEKISGEKTSQELEAIPYFTEPTILLNDNSLESDPLTWSGVAMEFGGEDTSFDSAVVFVFKDNEYCYGSDTPCGLFFRKKGIYVLGSSVKECTYVPHTITWDGNTEGKDVVNLLPEFFLVKVSEDILTKDQLVGGTLTTTDDITGEESSSVIVEDDIYEDSETLRDLSTGMLITKQNGVTVEGRTFPSAGTWFIKSDEFHMSALETVNPVNPTNIEETCYMSKVSWPDYEPENPEYPPIEGKSYTYDGDFSVEWGWWNFNVWNVDGLAYYRMSDKIPGPFTSLYNVDVYPYNYTLMGVESDYSELSDNGSYIAFRSNDVDDNYINITEDNTVVNPLSPFFSGSNLEVTFPRQGTYVQASSDFSAWGDGAPMNFSPITHKDIGASLIEVVKNSTVFREKSDVDPKYNGNILIVNARLSEDGWMIVDRTYKEVLEAYLQRKTVYLNIRGKLCCHVEEGDLFAFLYEPTSDGKNRELWEYDISEAGEDSVFLYRKYIDNLLLSGDIIQNIRQTWRSSYSDSSISGTNNIKQLADTVIESSGSSGNILHVQQRPVNTIQDFGELTSDKEFDFYTVSNIHGGYCWSFSVSSADILVTLPSGIMWPKGYEFIPEPGVKYVVNVDSLKKYGQIMEYTIPSST